MPSRRAFVQQVGTFVLGSTLTSIAPSARVEAVLFDAFPIFDPRPVAAVAEQLYPGRGAELMAAWRTRQFEYAWLRALAHDYADFWACTDGALRVSAASLHLDLAPADHERLMNAYRALRPWPEVPAALHALRDAGVRLGLLSNFSPAMLDGCVQTSGLGGLFEQVLSTDRVRSYKPNPRAYQLGLDALRLPRERVVFAAFAGWDAAGARRFGYPTYWVNRGGAPADALGATPDGTGATLDDLVAFVRARRA